MRCACSHVEWCSKNLYSASWYFTHSLLPAGRDRCHTEADSPATVTLTLGPCLLGCFAFVPLLQWSCSRMTGFPSPPQPCPGSILL